MRAPKEITVYQQPDGKIPFTDWFRALRDLKTQDVLLTRIRRVAAGNLGDCKSLGEGVHELRIHYGPGYRVYFAPVGQTVILLLAAGSKRSQRKDIQAAKNYFRQYQEEHA